MFDPDDESLAAGGLLARQAAAGARTSVVTTTWAPETRRAGELAAAARLLGASDPRLLGYGDERVPDSAPGRPRLVDAPLEDVVADLVAIIDELSPQVIVTHDRLGGLSGHADHVRTHHAAVAAAEACGLDAYLATHPHSALAAFEAAVGVRRGLHTVADDEVVVRLDVRPWLDTKVAAILAHRSEVERGALAGVIAGLEGEQRELVLGTEWYSRA